MFIYLCLQGLPFEACIHYELHSDTFRIVTMGEIEIVELKALAVEAKSGNLPKGYLTDLWATGPVLG